MNVMRTLLLIGGLWLGTLSLSSAQISLVGVTPDANNRIAVTTTATNTLHETAIDFRNDFSDTVQLMVIRVTNNLATNHYSYWCWGDPTSLTDYQCYPPSTDTATFSLTLLPNSTTSGEWFKPTLEHGNTPGQSTVDYLLYTTGGTSPDTIELGFDYNFTDQTTSRFAPQGGATLENPFPNPARANTNVAYTLPQGVSRGTLRVYNLLGEALRAQPITNPRGTARLDLLGMPAGVYMLSLDVDGKSLVTKRLVVR